MIGKQEIIEKIAKHQHYYKEDVIVSGRDKRKMSAVLNDYFVLLREALIKGHKWNISRFGTFSIEQDEITGSHQRKPINHHYRGEIPRLNKVLFNKNNIDTIYHIVIESDFMKKYKCRFRASQTTRLSLNKQLLKHGRLDYD